MIKPFTPHPRRYLPGEIMADGFTRRGGNVPGPLSRFLGGMTAAVRSLARRFPAFRRGEK